MTTPDKFVRPYEWGANPSKEATEDSHPIGSTLGVTLHWEGPHMGKFPHSECAGKVRAIERFHEYGRGWGDIAYNALVCPHGYVFEGRGAGVRSAANGSTEDNDAWYAVCYLGGQGDAFTRAGRRGFVAAVHWLRTAGNAGPRVNGHRDHKATACPGDRIYRWLRSADFAMPKGKPSRRKRPRRMSPAAYYLGATGEHVTWLGQRLVAHGFGKHYDVGPGPRFTKADRANVRAFQRAQGWSGTDADGFPGPETLRRLRAKPKPKRTPNADAGYRAAAKGVKANRGERRDTFAKARDLLARLSSRY